MAFSLDIPSSLRVVGAVALLFPQTYHMIHNEPGVKRLHLAGRIIARNRDHLKTYPSALHF
jgi:hypothetical protein